jgi:pimeloyl-ACP methyl ester carboxylesterase
MTPTQIRPFRIEVLQRDLDHLRARLEQTRWAAPADEEYGFALPRLRRLVDYWLTGYDWRAQEARLNSHPQFVTEIDGQPLHFLHVRCGDSDAVPLILTHGWPGSIVEYLDLIRPLTEPGKAGGQAFDMVIPSLPGFGFSGPASSPGWGTQRTARAWAELMARLGYDRYGAVGNDAGSMISPEVGRQDPEHVAGVHVTQLYSFPSGAPGEMDDLSAEEHDALGVLSWFWEHKGAFKHASQPAAADTRPRHHRLTRRAARLERATVRRVTRRGLCPHQHHAVLAHQHRRHIHPLLLRRRPGATARRADQDPPRARRRLRR